MAPINLAAFTNIANNSQLNRLEVSPEGTGIVEGGKAFSKGNVSRNMAVRQAFTGALTSEFGRYAKIPLGFRSGRSPLSTKAVQKLLNKALEGKDAKQYLDPKKADHLVTTFEHHVKNTKPELVFAANILASGKVDAQ